MRHSHGLNTSPVSVFLLCSADCDKACKKVCNGPGPVKCAECAVGYTRSEHGVCKGDREEPHTPTPTSHPHTLTHPPYTHTSHLIPTLTHIPPPHTHPTPSHLTFTPHTHPHLTHIHLTHIIYPYLTPTLTAHTSHTHTTLTPHTHPHIPPSEGPSFCYLYPQ